MLREVSRASALPDVQLIQPVLFRPFHRDGWVYEEKYDGWRMAAFKDGRNVRLVSRRGVDHTERFAEVADAVGRLPARTLILDGEVCSSMNRSSRTCTCSWESPAAAAYSRLV
jgi:bifunctional non-homologous end joining protein LigD